MLSENNRINKIEVLMLLTTIVLIVYLYISNYYNTRYENSYNILFIFLIIIMFIIDFFTICSIALKPREGYRRSNAKWGFIIGEVLLMAMIFMVLKAREKIKDILDYARVFIAFILALLQVHTINSEEVDLFMNNVIIKGVLAAVTISISLATKLKGNNFHTEIYSLYRIIPILGALYIY